MTLEQLRATVSAGGVTDITLKGQHGGFLMEITTSNGRDAFLARARSIEPRLFGSLTCAMIVLRDLGIAVAQIDITNWVPDQKDMSSSRQSRDQTMRGTHEAAAFNQWLAKEIQEALDDPRPSVPQDEVLATQKGNELKRS